MHVNGKLIYKCMHVEASYINVCDGLHYILKA